MLIYKVSNWRSLFALAHDICMAAFAWVLAYLLRFNFELPDEFQSSLRETLLLVVPIQTLIFITCGLYQGVWRFASIPDLKRILYAVTIGIMIVTSVLFMLRLSLVVPRSVLILDPLLLLSALGGSRFVYRAWKEHKLYGITQMHGDPVLILGSGDAAITLIKDLARSSEWRVIGILDDDVNFIGRHLQGIKVLGMISELPFIAQRAGVRHVIVAMPYASHQARRKAVDVANASGLSVLTVPSFEDLMDGKVSVSQIRRVEVEDLLGREPVELDNDGLHALIEARVIFVSGAGGSIGSELCRQLARFSPQKIVFYEISEYALYQLEQEFSLYCPKIKIACVTGDVKNEKRLKSVFEQHNPSVVFHAAAYKHVPLMENYNVAEALNNNVVGTYTLAKVAKLYSVEKFVLISTDKAVNPTNVMGASKRLAEMVCQGLQDDFSTKQSGTRFVIVRFGNVLGSSGSVIPKFKEQIAKGGPVTVTHPEITRYFMSIPEATQLVMQAALMGSGAEIFVLDMGAPVKIAELARDMIRLSGLHENDIQIEYTGLRPGEKLYEELLADDEHTLPTPHPKLRIAVARNADKVWVRALLKWIESLQTLDEAIIKQELKMWVEEYVGDINAEANQNGTPTFTIQNSTIH